MEQNPIGQHDLPAAYLRRFSSKKNHVWCMYENEYKGKLIEEKSVKSDFFKHDDIYTLKNAEEPYALERLLNHELENKYFSIIQRIKNCENIEPEQIGCLALWMYISKSRILSYKEDLASTLKSLLKHSMALTRDLNEGTRGRCCMNRP